MKLLNKFFILLVIFSACNKADKVTYFDHSTLGRISNLAGIEPPPPIFSFPPVFVLAEKTV